MVKVGSWDKGVDYQTIYNSLVWRIRREKNPKRKAYYAILLIQLRNGLRISEAVRAYKEWLKTGNKEIEVKVSKKKKEETRLVIIPDELDPSAKLWELQMVEDKKLIKRLKMFAIRKLNINTHSLRYAYITMLLRNGVNPSIIAKITKHSKLDFILTYTQQKEAERILREMG
ncbi:MAG: integrase [Candidatus Aenigmatarchaeota archaeon]